MCYYRLYIFLGCGHSTFASTPVRYCANATTLAKNMAREEVSLTQPNTQLNTTSTIDVAQKLDTGSRKTIGESSTTTRLTRRENDNTKGPRKSTKDKEMQPCEQGEVHPLHTVRLEPMCADCALERDARLRALEFISTEIKINPGRWQWKYHGSSQQQPPPRHNVEGPTEVVEDATPREKVDSGVWTVGTKWLRDWKDQG
jgi:hypothetical protein